MQLPLLKDKTLIIADPMLATGKSMVTVYEAIKKFGAPKKIHIISVIGSVDGVHFIKKYFPEKYPFVDSRYRSGAYNNGYIVPGLGDAGDLSYGIKL